MSLVGKIIHFITERKARKMDFAALKSTLKTSGDSISQRIDLTVDSLDIREKVCHLTGIERWAQHRLRMVLAVPTPDADNAKGVSAAVVGTVGVLDEYDSYRPSPDMEYSALRASFRLARADTLTLIDELQKIPGAENKTVPHNDMGPLSVRGWLVYLDMHSKMESRNIK